MFINWSGYEIDGSDTTYNLILPDRLKMKEVIEFYLSLPIWDKSKKIYFNNTDSGVWAPHRSLDKISVETNAKNIADTVISPDWNGAGNFVTYCLPPELLPQELKDEVFALSKTRPGAENKIYTNIDPVTGLFDYRNDLGVGFQIFAENDSKKWVFEDPDGLIFNNESIIKNFESMNASHYKITCGPTFIYEYAAYIMTKLSERYPELGIDGGRDCENGFIDGCTYSVNLYDFERFTFETTDVSSLINELNDKEIIKYVIKKGKWHNELEYCNKSFSFSNNSTFSSQDYNLDFEKEIENRSKNFFNKIFTKTVIKKILSNGITPEEYQEWVSASINDDSFTDLDCLFRNAVLVGVNTEEYPNVKWENIAYITVRKSNNSSIVELRVPHKFRGIVDEQLKNNNIKYV